MEVRSAVVGLYTIKDVEAAEFAPPFPAVNDAIATRQYRRMMEKETIVGTYELVHVGFYNFGSGRIDAIEPRIVNVGE